VKHHIDNIGFKKDPPMHQFCTGTRMVTPPWMVMGDKQTMLVGDIKGCEHASHGTTGTWWVVSLQPKGYMIFAKDSSKQDNFSRLKTQHPSRSAALSVLAKDLYFAYMTNLIPNMRYH
jgi:hypothetical protein